MQRFVLSFDPHTLFVMHPDMVPVFPFPLAFCFVFFSYDPVFLSDLFNTLFCIPQFVVLSSFVFSSQYALSYFHQNIAPPDTSRLQILQ
jgi:hypothetical protein